jgi:hypothetical protein
MNPVSDVNTRDPPDMKARHVVASEFWRLIIRRAISKSDEKVAGICNLWTAALLIERNSEANNAGVKTSKREAGTDQAKLQQMATYALTTLLNQLENTNARYGVALGSFPRKQPLQRELSKKEFSIEAGSAAG